MQLREAWERIADVLSHLRANRAPIFPRTALFRGAAHSFIYLRVGGFRAFILFYIMSSTFFVEFREGVQLPDVSIAGDFRPASALSPPARLL